MDSIPLPGAGEWIMEPNIKQIKVKKNLTATELHTSPICTQRETEFSVTTMDNSPHSHFIYLPLCSSFSFEALVLYFCYRFLNLYPTH